MSSNNLLTQAEMWDDSELIKMYDDGVKGVNTATSDRSSSRTASGRRKWKNGETCMAPWEEQWYPAKIVRVIPKDRAAFVLFEGFEEEGEVVVDLKAILGADEVEYKDEETVEGVEGAVESIAPSTLIEPGLNATAIDLNLATNMDVAPVPKILPPPPELFATMSDDKEITNNMMLSWYMSGYHTGYYQAMKDLKAKATVKK